MKNTETKEPVSFTNEKLADIRRSETEVIRIARTHYKGVHYIDIRVFFEPKDGGEYRPTKKGVSFKEDLFGPFAEAIRSAEAMLAQAV